MSDLVERLEPCPFCAGIADDTHAGGAPELHEDSHTNIYVWCPNCGAKGLVVVGSHGGTREEAIAAWNRRAESPELTRLRSEVERRDLQLEVAAKAALKLSDEVERLTRERDEARAGWKTASELLDAAVGDYNTEHDALTTLTARTREVLAAMMQALRSIDTRATVPHGDATPGPMGSDNFMHDLRWIADTAREAMTTANTLFNELKEKDNG